jgi:hypothetical protein
MSAGNRIKDWGSIDALDQFPNLKVCTENRWKMALSREISCTKCEGRIAVLSPTYVAFQEVRLSDNPLTDLNAGGAPRYLFVARLRKVSILNGSEVGD